MKKTLCAWLICAMTGAGLKQQTQKNNSIVRSRNCFLFFLTLAFAVGCGSDDPARSSEKQIISFTLSVADHTFLDEDLSGTIDHESGSVTLVLPPASNLAGLAPTIQLSPGALVSPGSGTEQDFSAPVTYTVTAEDGSTQGYTVTISVALHSDKAFLNFDFLSESNSTIKNEINGTINTNDLSVSLEVPYNSDRSALTPNFTLSPGASSSPASGEVQDFTNPVTYTITAEDGSTNDYKVSVGYTESQAQILSFSFLAEENDALFVDVEGTIEGTLVSLEVPATTEVSNLKGQATLSTGATTSIDLQIGRDYTNDIIIDVTGQDLSSDSYTIHVFETDEKAVLLELATANPDNTLNWSEDTDISTWEGVTMNEGKLIRLYLNNHITASIPKSIGKLVHLTQVEIYNDSKIVSTISKLPSEIGRLIKLTDLALEGHELTELPEEIGDLTNLEVLNLHNGQLSQLPISISQLTMLKDLLLGENQFTELPISIGQLISLEEINLSFNQIVNLPATIAELAKLRSLNLEGNYFAQIPDVVFDLNQLHYLYLRNNSLTFLPESISNLTSLRYLILENNDLTVIPTTIGNLTNLRGLWVANNDFTLIPSEICDLRPELTIYKDADMYCEPK